MTGPECQKIQDQVGYTYPSSITLSCPFILQHKKQLEQWKHMKKVWKWALLSGLDHGAFEKQCKCMDQHDLIS